MVMQKQTNSPDFFLLLLPSIIPMQRQIRGEIRAIYRCLMEDKKETCTFSAMLTACGVVCCTSECLHVEACVVSVGWRHWWRPKPGWPVAEVGVKVLTAMTFQTSTSIRCDPGRTRITTAPSPTPINPILPDTESVKITGFKPLRSVTY